MMEKTFVLGVALVASGLVKSIGYGAEIKFVGPDASRGVSGAVVVGDVALAHTGQLLPLDHNGNFVGERDVAKQVEQILINLEGALRAVQSDLDQLVKLNIYVTTQDAVTTIDATLAKRFPTERKPAVSYVVTRLPHPSANVAIDAVAVVNGEVDRSVSVRRLDRVHRMTGGHVSILPPGTRIYVAGQAEKGATLAEETRRTLESLRNTLQFLGRQDRDIVSLKAFLSPMSEIDVLNKELAAFFGAEKVPPFSCVEWTTPLIEIELVAWGGDHNSGPVVEFLTPPGMNASPVYSRVARINSCPSIYVSGLFAPNTSGATAETKDVFARLGKVLEATGSDYKHLAKATYYCATDAASQKLNEIRPNYYDPQRPPSASKAMVAGVGRDHSNLTVDMIAVPAWDNVTAEYGPAESGYRLSGQQSQEGWLSLYDGQSTFGWSGAKTDAQGLCAGTTTSAFGSCVVNIEATSPGTISKGRKTVPVENRQTITFDDSTDPIQLDEKIRVKWLHVQPAGLQTIFDGQHLTDWQRIDHPSLTEDKRPAWSVSDGSLHAVGGPGAMEYVGKQFGDFVMQLDVRTAKRHANGGVFFRAIPRDFMNGYEAQIYNRGLDGDPSRPARYSTGALDDHQMARRLVSRDGEFFTMTVVANGPHIATWVNGAQMTDWTDERSKHENPRMGLRTAAGTIQLQAHDPGTAVNFGKIRIAELKPK